MQTTLCLKIYRPGTGTYLNVEDEVTRTGLGQFWEFCHNYVALNYPGWRLLEASVYLGELSDD